MSATGKEPDKNPKFPEWLAFAQAVDAGRSAKKLTKTALASEIGAGPSWITQLINADMRPSIARIAALEKVLGIDLQSLQPTTEPDTAPLPPKPDEGAITSLYWAGRVNLLEALSYKHKSQTIGLRLKEMSRTLEKTAAQQPLARQFTFDKKKLQKVDEIAASVQLVGRLAVFSELAFMKVDAPYDCRISESDRVSSLQHLAHDLGLRDEWENLHPKVTERYWSRPAWSDLNSVGGPLGTLKIRLAGNAEEDFELLAGADPFGWFGLDFIAGRWLVCPEQRQFIDLSTLDGDERKGLTSGKNKRIVNSGALEKAGFPAIHTASFEMQANYGLRDAAPQLIGDDRNSALAFMIIESIGTEWLSVELQKLELFYELSETFATKLDLTLSPALPKKDFTLSALHLLKNYADEQRRSESELSDTTSKTSNARLRLISEVQSLLKKSISAMEGRK